MSVLLLAAMLRLVDGRDVVEIQSIAANVIRVHIEPGGRTSPRTLMVDPNRTWHDVASHDIAFKVAHSPLRLTFYDASGVQILRQESSGDGTLRFSYAKAGSFYGVTNTNNAGWHDVLPRLEDIRHGLRRNEGGTVAAGEQGNGGAPLIFTKRYGLVVDSDGGGFLVSDGTLRFRGGSRKDAEYFVIAGNPMVVMRAVADITGRPPMMPKWTLGFLNSQWGSDATEVTNIVKEYRAKSIPIDGFILDFDWKAWGEDDYGEWRWNSTRGPGNVDPDKFPGGVSGSFARSMRDLGVHLAGIFKPRILLTNAFGKTNAAAAFAFAHHLFLPGRPYEEYVAHRPALDLDFSKTLTRSWFWQHAAPAYR
ncbi:MAG TPA: TIM-barrel domain-containing protein, partial [Candidatus Baltobacteraceae bacterium]|nr:TIM-barrel domain-containing protein [Candidatus Baltobacteraceae bacterium]